jgi:ParB/RepB/Spo0J family partition protein
MSRSSTMVTLSGIAVPPERLRAFRPDNVEAISESMNAQGQLQEVLLRHRPGGGHWLVAGYHRLEAARKLKWETVRCIILEDVDADHAELIEIDENLIRAELTPVEQAMHITRRKELYEKLHPETKNGANQHTKRVAQVEQPSKAFVINTARKTRKGRSTVQKAATRGKKVKVLADIAGTSLDKGTELDALAKLSECEQKKLATRAKAGEKVSAMEARAKAGKRSGCERQIAELIREDKTSWMDNFISTAVVAYAKEVADAGAEAITRSTNGMFNGHAWVECAKQILAKRASGDVCRDGEAKQAAPA